MKILEIKNLSLKSKKSNALLLNNISLTLNKGETLGIVGESGSGKTLTGLSVTGLLDSSILRLHQERSYIVNKTYLHVLKSI